jgi:flavin-dependent dehydrogenase
VTEVHGMRNVGNLYRHASGPGWVLVGDALHQKDPLDGQGIYDAVFSAKRLATALGGWKHGMKSWEQAMAEYEADVRAETAPMYQHTLRRVKTEVYTEYSERALRTYLRWLNQDPEYKRRTGLMLVRGLDPREFLPRRLLFEAMLRGGFHALAREVGAYLSPRFRPPSHAGDW